MAQAPQKKLTPSQADAPPAVETLPEDFAAPGFVKATERLPIETAPKDGRWIEVTKDGKTWTRARWYETRVRAAGSIAWVKARCWSTSEPSKLAHSVEAPIGWREAQ
jgi:hypothetical protein